ncbi:HNH endonuclease [Chamaesiphon sp. GL140_3_metabinner_50]|uniref:HNH endonuclease n=1 Tax=Chamaesiphon sp. GL140_3_metabinner_50 TaxID=2970812 RepID=UPI0025D59D06|nr:HNH endonuclease [Chamaesiphon sp. GL140_3_metabinner_50]
MSQITEAHCSRDLAYYCNCFATLNVSKTKERGTANHQPILILSVLELITQKSIIENRIFVSTELIETFKKYWSILVTKSTYTDALHYPFVHLQSGRFWHVKFNDAYEGERIKTTNKLKEKVEYAYLDDELFDLLQDSSIRQVLVDSLVNTWFTDSKLNLAVISDIDIEFDRVKPLQLPNLDSEIKITLRKSIVRNSFFRKLVVREYDYRCAFCKLRIIRDPNQNIVDGAHIKPFSEFLDSKIDNGLSLCKNHHWAFDLGWFSIDDNYRIIVAQGLDDDSPYTRAMKDFDREPIALPSNKRYFPRLESLKWHRENKFKP